jgi:excisionase family DNA binding protein
MEIHGLRRDDTPDATPFDRSPGPGKIPHMAQDVEQIEQTEGAQVDRLVGANEAAKFLGIHRSTLHQAVKNGTITPDLTTQGGHYRFNHTTLESFAIRIAREPVTTLSELLPELTTTLGDPDGRSHLCLKAHDRIRHALPDLPVFAVLGLKPHARSLNDLEIVASSGFPDWSLPELIGNLDRRDYEVKYVLRTMQSRYFGDTRSAEDLHAPTRSLTRRSALQAFAIFPLIQDGQARGVLAVGGPRARKFQTPDIAFLQNTADELAIALACHDYMDGARAQILTSGELMREALKVRAERSSLEKRGDSQISPLVDLFREATGADAVYLTGPGVELAPRDPERQRLMRRVSRRKATATERWGDADPQTTGIAVLAPINTRANIVVAAEWKTEVVHQQEFEALLYVFAAACAIALGMEGRSRQAVRPPTPRASHANAPAASLR